MADQYGSQGGTGGAPDQNGGSGGTYGTPGDAGANGNSLFYGGGGGGGGAGAKGGNGGSFSGSSGGPSGGAGGASGSAGTPGAGNGAMGSNASGLDGAGGGGGGGNGIADATGGTFTIGASVTGGYGGAGGNGDSNSGSRGGGGGSGGFGFAETGSGGQVTANGTLTGGTGGNGGSGSSGNAGNSNGGDGGGGAYFKGSSDLTVKSGAKLLGGTGGKGGSGGTGNYYGGDGGAGGNGVVMAGGGGLNNYGTIIGGTGGQAGGGSAGVGGAGVIGRNIVVADKSGATIAGGMSADGTTQADAITFTGGSNSLLLGGTISGDIGVSGTVALGSSTESQATLANTIHDASYGTGAVSTLNSLGTGSNIVLTGANTYSGGTTITSGSTLVLGSSPVYDSSGTLTSAAAGTGAISFGNTGGASADLELQASAQPIDVAFSNKLTDFGSAGSQLDLDNFNGTSVSYDSTNMSIVVKGTNASGLNVAEAFDLVDPMATSYMLKRDGSGTVIEAVTCFASGTPIRTARGREIVDVAVEALRVGDLVVTASGAHRPIRWLGHRTIDLRRHPRPQEAMPVRIAAHAIADNRPARDLFVSPGHAICLDLLGEVLVSAIALVNGATVTQDEVETVTYWHVELDSHDIILAENLPTESYLDVGNRAFFAEADVIALDAAPGAPAAGTADYCRPFYPCESTLVAVVRDQLRVRATALGWRLAAPAAPDDLWLEVDGVRVDPVRDGLVARALLPAAARDIFLCSSVAVPALTAGEPDGRRLGVKLAGLVVDDGLACRREIGCDDPRLADGFYGDEGTHRWSDGRARLPAELWTGVADDFYLRIALAGPVLPRWVAPTAKPTAGMETGVAEAA